MKIRPKVRSVLDRFMRKVSMLEGSCWEWTAANDGRGYGKFKLGPGPAAPLRANRVAYELFVAPIPDGKQVLHSCDNPKCVNPAHLRIGTVAENVADMAKRWRGRKSGKGFPFGARRRGSRWESRCWDGVEYRRLGSYKTSEEASSVATKFKINLHEAVRRGEVKVSK